VSCISDDCDTAGDKDESFHEKAGECQAFSFISSLFLFFVSSSLFLFSPIAPIQPSRLCRHPSIRTLM